MAEILKDWVRDIFIVVTALCFAEIVLPEGSMRKYLKFIFSIIILGVVISPVNYFFDDACSTQAFSDKSGSYVSRLEQKISDSGNSETENGNSAEHNDELEQIQSIQLERVYKQKIISEINASIADYYPEINIYEIEVYLNESEKSTKKELEILNKVVIIGEETEYVSNIVRCAAQRLGVEDDRISYQAVKEKDENE